MQYQSMLIGNQPYYVSRGQAKACHEHRHPEIEFSFCANESYSLLINNTQYTIPKNHLAIIGPMISHSMLASDNPDVLVLTIEISPVLLMDFFEPFSKVDFPSPVFSLVNCDPRLSDLLYETLELCRDRTGLTEMMIKGNLYKICYYIYEEFIRSTDSRQKSKAFRDIQKVEEAIGLIHSQYAQPLTVKYVAAHVQYSESQFCRVFKNITGITFHCALNRCRVKNACCLLKETTNPISEIALLVGFTDTKTFCYVFKQYTGYTPKIFRNDDTLSLGSLDF